MVIVFIRYYDLIVTNSRKDYKRGECSGRYRGVSMISADTPSENMCMLHPINE